MAADMRLRHPCQDENDQEESNALSAPLLDKDHAAPRPRICLQVQQCRYRFRFWLGATMAALTVLSVLHFSGLHQKKHQLRTTAVSSVLFSSSSSSTKPTTSFSWTANFDGKTDNDGFTFEQQAFRTKSEGSPSCKAQGLHLPMGGHSGGALQVTLQPGHDDKTGACSGGYQHKFTLDRDTRMTLRFWFQLSRSRSSSTNEDAELAQALASVDGTLVGQAPYEQVALLVTPSKHQTTDRSTGWKLFERDLGVLSAGEHTVVLGAAVNLPATVTFLLDEVALFETAAVDVQDYEYGPQAAVDRLDFSRFKSNIKALSDFGDRYQGTDSYNQAADWARVELTNLGYSVEEAKYRANGETRSSLYATKVGTKFPDRMFIVSGHLDGRGFGGGADDNASGSSAVFEFARIFAMPDVTTDVSIRLVLWNNEEKGCKGSKSYANGRLLQQGKEDPPSSGIFPEPTWLGMLEHDMILFDHGNPAQLAQSSTADADIEYQADSVTAEQSRLFAEALYQGSQKYATTYPAKVGTNMASTDSIAFQDMAPAVSVRENQRHAGGFADMNPHWHGKSDVYESYSEEDFEFGFNFVKMTLGTIGELAGLRIKSQVSKS